MAETTITVEAYSQRQQEDCSIMASILSRELGYRLRAGNLFYGPTYEIGTKNGSALKMHLYRMHNSETERIDVIAVQNDTGQVVGHRIVNLKDHGDYIEGTGSIYVAERGVGLAKPIEIVVIHHLQAEADTRGKDVVVQGQNRNSERLQHVIRTIEAEQAAGLPLSYDPSLVESLTKESQRWFSLFGPYGSLGFDHNLRKTFTSIPKATAVSPGDVIHLAQEEVIVNERRLVRPKVVSFEKVQGDFEIEKKKLLQNTILPQLEKIAA